MPTKKDSTKTPRVASKGATKRRQTAPDDPAPATVERPGPPGRKRLEIDPATNELRAVIDTGLTFIETALIIIAVAVVLIAIKVF